MTTRILVGDALSVLRTLPSESVHMCVTSPPFYGLRDYGTGVWQMPDSTPAPEMFECEDCQIVRHISTLSDGCPKCGQTMIPHGHRGSDRWYTEKTAAVSSAGAFSEAGPSNAARLKQGRWREGGTCHCSAEYVDKQIGLEATPELWCAAMVAVFREVRRVLRADGTLWLNIGDSYAGSWGNQGRKSERGTQRPINGEMLTPVLDGRYPALEHNTGKAPPGCKPKDLIGIPWLLAFALRADGWYLRSEIIWHKPNPMPESVTDRPTKAHEQLFLLSKSRSYFYDADAIREPHEHKIQRYLTPARKDTPSEYAAGGSKIRDHRNYDGVVQGNPAGRNKRSVWTVATEPFPESHFATYPTALIEPCIKAGTSERGVCPECGAPWVRVVERGELVPNGHSAKDPAKYRGEPDGYDFGHAAFASGMRPGMARESKTTGWRPSCKCEAEPVPATVLDPFFGAGTTGLVADRLNRNCIGIELNESYAAMAQRRINGEAPMFSDVSVA